MDTTGWSLQWLPRLCKLRFKLQDRGSLVIYEWQVTGVLSAVKFQMNVLCAVCEGANNAGEEFSVTHGWVSASNSRPSLAGTDAQRRDVSICVACFTVVSAIVVISL